MLECSRILQACRPLPYTPRAERFLVRYPTENTTRKGETPRPRPHNIDHLPNTLNMSGTTGRSNEGKKPAYLVTPPPKPYLKETEGGALLECGDLPPPPPSDYGRGGEGGDRCQRQTNNNGQPPLVTNRDRQKTNPKMGKKLEGQNFIFLFFL